MNIYKCSSACSSCNEQCNPCACCNEPHDCCCCPKKPPCIFATLNPDVECLTGTRALTFTKNFVDQGCCAVHDCDEDEIKFIASGRYKILYSVSVTSCSDTFPKTITTALKLDDDIINGSVETATVTNAAKVKVLTAEVTVHVQAHEKLRLIGTGTNISYSNALIRIEKIDC